MKLKKLIDKIIGFEDETLIDYIQSRNFKPIYRTDNYTIYRNKDTEILYDDLKGVIINIYDYESRINK